MPGRTLDILFIIKSIVDGYGYSQPTGLINAANLLSVALKTINVDSRVIVIDGENEIDNRLYTLRPEHTVIEALWITPEKLEELAVKYRDTKFSIRVHSKTPFLSQDSDAMDSISQYMDIAKRNPNVKLSSNNKYFVDDISKASGFKFDYLPNIYPIPEHRRHPKEFFSPKRQDIHIGCFGAIRPMKNHLQQATAAIRFADAIGKKLYFHINNDQVEENDSNIVRNLRGLFKANGRHELVEHGWMPNEEFLDLVVQMDVTMQVSMSESFNLTIGDAISNDVPSIGSTDIDWLPSELKAIPTDTDDIVKKLARAWSYGYTAENRRSLGKYNHKAIRIWRKYLDKLDISFDE